MCWSSGGTKTRLNSKEFVEICNKNGHCVSYDTVLRIESCWADEILNNDEGYACIPNNIASDLFTQAVADNSDYGQENSSQHITNTILLQYPNEHNFNFNVNLINTVVKKKSRRKSIILQPILLTDLLLNKQPPSPNYFQSINIDLLLSFSKSFAMKIMKSTDTTWILSRSIPSKVFEMKDVNGQLVPGWTGFHSLLSSKVSIPTTIGYCRSIPAASTNPNVVLTMMINVEKMLSSIGQTIVLTVDESIYEIAKRIQFQLSPQFDHMVVRLGGFHRAKNFIGVIGKRMESSGFEEVLEDSGLYGETQIKGIIHAKHYNRSVVAHKVMFEAFSRIYWKSFKQWFE